MKNQICFGDEPLSSVIDRIVAATTRAVPALDAGACRHLLELIFWTRVRQTDACGRYLPCRHFSGCAGWSDRDPDALPEMFGAAAAALARVAIDDRTALARALSAAFRDILSPLLRDNPNCGRADICRSPATFPLRTRTRRASGDGDESTVSTVDPR